ncbi:hypothetical protein QJQ45_006961 [Haematococcus lacustris]|nr:hypothetical protein QJQ45_006961 [Haematococcus lacustris]
MKNQSAEGLSIYFLAQWFCGDTLNLLGCLLQGEQLATTKALSMYFIIADVLMLTQFLYYGALNQRKAEAARKLALRKSTYKKSKMLRQSMMLAGNSTGPLPPALLQLQQEVQQQVSQLHQRHHHTHQLHPSLYYRPTESLVMQSNSAAQGHAVQPRSISTHLGGPSRPATQGSRASRASPGLHSLTIPSQRPADEADGQVVISSQPATGSHPISLTLHDVSHDITPGRASCAEGDDTTTMPAPASQPAAEPQGSMRMVLVPPTPGARTSSTLLLATLGLAALLTVAAVASRGAPARPDWAAWLPGHAQPGSVAGAAAAQQLPAPWETSGLGSSSSPAPGGSSSASSRWGEAWQPRVRQEESQAGADYASGGSWLPPSWTDGSIEWTKVLGSAFGYCSMVLYLTSRMSQIYKNWSRKSAEGLSVIMFVFTISANLCTGCSMLLRSRDIEDLQAQAPWLGGAFGTVALDAFIFWQVGQPALTVREDRAGCGGIIVIITITIITITIVTIATPSLSPCQPCPTPSAALLHNFVSTHLLPVLHGMPGHMLCCCHLHHHHRRWVVGVGVIIVISIITITTISSSPTSTIQAKTPLVGIAATHLAHSAQAITYNAVESLAHAAEAGRVTAASAAAMAGLPAALQPRRTSQFRYQKLPEQC